MGYALAGGFSVCGVEGSFAVKPAKEPEAGPIAKTNNRYTNWDATAEFDVEDAQAELDDAFGQEG